MPMTLAAELHNAGPRTSQAGLTPQLVVTVLTTTDRETSAALTTAGTLARNLGAIIRLVTFVIVPYPLDLANPPVPPSFTIDHSQSLARCLNLEMQLQICYCRDIGAALGRCLGSKSVVVIGRKKKRWFRRETKLVRLVRSRDHHLVLVDVD